MEKLLTDNIYFIKIKRGLFVYGKRMNNRETIYFIFISYRSIQL